MNVAIWILLVQASLGTFDTLYYHEYKLKLAHADHTGIELRLHAARDFAYAIIIGTLGWVTWHGAWTYVLFALLIAEIVITMWDFVEEDKIRKLPPGERITHTIMGIVYGGFLAFLLPEMWAWSHEPLGFGEAYHGIPAWILSLIAGGVFASGVRDLVASLRPRGASG
ncbi:MAG: hypothetical protein IH944_00790 [Armatimonadetes bacterium]|nr:hypothetical protein [Armatimonadota bacterium]